MEYIYDAPDTPVSLSQLAAEIKAGLGYGTKMWLSPDTLTIWFETALTPAEKATLDTLIDDHVVAPPPPLPIELLLESLDSYGVHSYTPAQVDAFIDGVSTVAELRALLKTMAKCIIAYAEYFEA